MPGNYVFEAEADRPQTGLAGNPIKIGFIIMPPIWKRWWAISGLAFAGALILLAIARLYYLHLLANEKAEFDKKLSIEKERQRISNDMHDDIGASLSAMKLFTSSMQGEDDTNENFQEIYDMMDELSTKVKQVIWRLDKNSDTLESLIFFTEALSYNLFKNARPKIKVTLPDIIPDIVIAGEKRHDITLVLKEALHNIIKHSGASEAFLNIELVGAYLQIMVRDNGLGILPHTSGIRPGHGVINMQERIRKLGGQFRIESNNGTIIKLKIPINKQSNLF
jgi:signal transduction histidine kinase